MMTQRHVDEWYTAYLEGSLSEHLREEVDAHLRECPRCAAAVADMRLLVAELRELPDMAAPVGFTGDVRARLQQRPRPSFAWRAPALAAGLLGVTTLLVTLTLLRWSPLPEPTVTAGRARTLASAPPPAATAVPEENRQLAAAPHRIELQLLPPAPTPKKALEQPAPPLASIRDPFVQPDVDGASFYHDRTVASARPPTRAEVRDERRVVAALPASPKPEVVATPPPAATTNGNKEFDVAAAGAAADMLSANAPVATSEATSKEPAGAAGPVGEPAMSRSAVNVHSMTGNDAGDVATSGPGQPNSVVANPAPDESAKTVAAEAAPAGFAAQQNRQQFAQDGAVLADKADAAEEKEKGRVAKAMPAPQNAAQADIRVASKDRNRQDESTYTSATRSNQAVRNYANMRSQQQFFSGGTLEAEAPKLPDDKGGSVILRLNTTAESTLTVNYVQPPGQKAQQVAVPPAVREVDLRLPPLQEGAALKLALQSGKKTDNFYLFVPAPGQQQRFSNLNAGTRNRSSSMVDTMVQLANDAGVFVLCPAEFVEQNKPVPISNMPPIGALNSLATRQSQQVGWGNNVVNITGE